MTSQAAGGGRTETGERTSFFPPRMPPPAADRVTQPFWDACREHRLVVQRCARCGTYRFPPKPVCYECRGFEWQWVESRGEAEVYSFIIVHHPSHPATTSVIPYNV